jgi:hypothetical protein
MILMIFLLSLAEASLVDMLESRVNSGKSHYEFYKTSGSCWESAIQSMISTCESMNEESQSFFALKLTNCHLKRLGLKELNCEIGKCELDSNTYIAYTQFFTHSFDICVYLSYHQWQVDTKKTVEKLASASSKTLELLQESSLVTQEVLDKQKEMKAEVDKNKEQMTLFVKEFVETTQQLSKEINKQQEFIAGWFQRIYAVVVGISEMQENVLGQVWDLNCFLFFLVFCCFLAAVTSFPETFSQRAKVFTLAVGEVFVERCLSLNLKCVRTTVVLICIGIVVAGVKRYREYDRLSYDYMKSYLGNLQKKEFLVFTPRRNHVTSISYDQKELMMKSICKNSG